MEKGGKRNDDTPQHEAVREAFTNAIIHCDLMMDAGILRIEKHDDRLCFRNPGLLKLPEETIYRGGNSKARNPKIQNMLRMIGFGENVGSGFPKIIAAWKETNWGEPQLLNKLDVDEVELVLPVPSPKTAPVNATVNATAKMSDVLKDVLKNVQKDVLKKLTERQIDILELIVHSPTITLNEMSKRVGVSVKTIQRDFTEVRKLGIQINRKDGKTYGVWEVIFKE